MAGVRNSSVKRSALFYATVTDSSPVYSVSVVHTSSFRKRQKELEEEEKEKIKKAKEMKEKWEVLMIY